MVNRQLARIPGDHSLYLLEGVGTLRLEGVSGSRETAEAAGRHWHFARRGFWRQLQATDAVGAVAGTFERRLLGGGTVRWADREFALRRASVWRERYVLADGDRELALLDAKGWGRRPVTMSVSDDAALDPGLLLYAAFVAHVLAGDAAAAAAVAATTAGTVSSG
jgi:hypothetical protein